MDSFASSLTQVQYDSSLSGPISRLPNELVHAFLIKLEMHELIRLRLVCPRWKAVIELIAQTKKSLILSCGSFFAFDDFNEMSHSFQMNKRFFGQIDLKRDFELINLKSNVLSRENVRNFGPFLVALFPSVQQLVIQSCHLYNFHSVLKLWPVQQITTLSLSCDIIHHKVPQQVTHFANWINSLTALKRLDLKGDLLLLLGQISPNIFSNLEHFSHHTDEEASRDSVIIIIYVLGLLGSTGSNCTRLSLSGYGHLSTNVPNWFNADSIRSLTQLSFPFSPLNYQLWEDVCGKFTFLQTLFVRGNCLPVNGTVNVLSSRLLNILSRLPNLTELQLYGFAIDDLEPESNFTALVSVRVFVLYRLFRKANAPDRDQLAQFLATNLLPNVQQLTIKE